MKNEKFQRIELWKKISVNRAHWKHTFLQDILAPSGIVCLVTFKHKEVYSYFQILKTREQIASASDIYKIWKNKVDALIIFFCSRFWSKMYNKTLKSDKIDKPSKLYYLSMSHRLFGVNCIILMSKVRLYKHNFGMVSIWTVQNKLYFHPKSYIFFKKYICKYIRHSECQKLYTNMISGSYFVPQKYVLKQIK